VLGGEKEDDGAGFGITDECLQGLGHARDEAAVGVVERKVQRRRELQSRVGHARVFERPVAELLHEIAGKIREGGAFGARQHDHHGRAVGQAIVEQVSR